MLDSSKRISGIYEPVGGTFRRTVYSGVFSYIFNQMIRREYVVTMPGTTGLECFEDKGFSITPLFVSDTIGSWNELETVDFFR